MKLSQILSGLPALLFLSLPACHDTHAEEKGHEKSHEKSHEKGHDKGGHESAHEADQHKIVVTNPLAKDVTITQQYVSLIKSCRHTDIKALAFGILDEIPVKEGQSVNKGTVLFKVIPRLYQAKYESEVAEYQVALQEYENTKRLADQSLDGKNGLVSQRELMIFKAKLGKAEANVNKAHTELNWV